MLRTTARIATTRVAIVQLIAQRNAPSELPPTSEHHDGCAPRSPRELRRPPRMLRARVVRRAAAAPNVVVCIMRIGIVTTSTTQLGNVACALEWYRTRGRCRTRCSCAVCKNPSVIDRRTKAPYATGAFQRRRTSNPKVVGSSPTRSERMRDCARTMPIASAESALVCEPPRASQSYSSSRNATQPPSFHTHPSTTSAARPDCHASCGGRIVCDAPTSCVAPRRGQWLLCRMRIGIVTTSATQLGGVACALEWYRARGRCRTCCTCAVCNNPSVIARRKKRRMRRALSKDVGLRIRRLWARVP